ncbi:DUF6338 family protein [Pedococcus bigeumensis]|uniref:DUF6338 family protein n=1 Tax=Pedococcus bigeumensis TaxID=433644 RepID=UPI002FE7AA16
MPSDVTGLVVFVALLAPGFCHLLVVERQLAPGRQQPSALRELATVGLVSVLADAVALISYLLLGMWLDGLPKLETFAFERSAWQDHLGQGLALGLGLTVAACLLAYVWAAADLGRVLQSLLSRNQATALLLPRHAVDKTSSWWQVLFAEQPESYKWLECTMTDGTGVSGWLNSFNNRADEVPDRDLVLVAPIQTWGVGGASLQTIANGVVVISARDVRLMRVEYFSDPP